MGKCKFLNTFYSDFIVINQFGRVKGIITDTNFFFSLKNGKS